MLVVPMPPQASHLHPPPSSSSSSSSSAPNPSPAETRPKLASKPKLTLQTSSLPRTFGRSTTGLSLSLATASPTVSNTFKNAYEPCPPSALPTTSSSSSTSSPTKPSTPLKHARQPSSGNPYQVPLGVKSILRNSPLDSTAHRRSVSIGGGNGASGARRVFFPTKKQVTFRQSLEEEIRTVHYVARHSDLIAEESDSDNQKVVKQAPQQPQQPAQEASDSDSDSNSSLAPSDSGSDDDQTASLSKSERKKRKSLSAERQVRAVALLDGLEGDAYGISTPQTPRQGRVKRRREWRWTLGPVEARNEIYGLPQTPEEARFPEGTTFTSESEEKTHGHENENETESLGSCESDWTSASWSGSSVASYTNTKPDEFKTA